MTLRQALAHIKTVLLHKYWVFVYGRRCKVGLWQLLVHDLSKLGLAEFGPYARHFFMFNGTKREHSIDKDAREWTKALDHHYKHNPHHPQHWVHRQGENIYTAEMPGRHVEEMVADWMAAGKVYSGSMNVAKWYSENKDRLRLARGTTLNVEKLIAKVDPYGYRQYVMVNPLDEINRRNLEL